MNDLRLLELAAHVVAWHNRHPLARRIRVEDVHSMGYVVLPFVRPAAPASGPAAGAADDTAAPPVAPGAPDGPAGGSLRERAMARAQQGPGAVPLPSPLPAAPEVPSALAAPNAPSASSGRALKRGFGEDFIAPLSPRRVARWAARHGVEMLAPRQEAPVRRIAAESGHDAERLTDRWVLTAQVQTGSNRTRVLVGPGAAPALLGQRLWSPARVAALAAMVGTMVAMLAALRTGAFDPGSTLPAPLAAASAPADAAAAASSPADAAAAASSPADAAAAASAPADSALAASVVVGADWPTSAQSPSAGEPAGASSAPLVVIAPEIPAVQLADAAPPASLAAPPAAPAAATPAPVDVEPTLGRIDLPSLGPVIDERRRNQALARQQAGPVPPADAALASAATKASTAAPRVPVLQGPAFAVSTRPLRTRSEGEQVAEAMRALLVPPGSTQMQVDLLPAGADWRVVSWPYPSRAQADKARAMLVARGMRVEIIDF